MGIWSVVLEVSYNERVCCISGNFDLLVALDEVRGLPKSLPFILLWAWTSVPNFMSIHPIDVKEFPKCLIYTTVGLEPHLSLLNIIIKSIYDFQCSPGEFILWQTWTGIVFT